MDQIVKCRTKGLLIDGKFCASFSQLSESCKRLDYTTCSASEITTQVADEEFKLPEKHELPTEEPKSVLDVQIGGEHYKKLGIYQPWQVCAACMTPEELRGYMKGTVIAYLMRERDKGGDSDIRKAMHTIQLWEEVRKDK